MEMTRRIPGVSIEWKFSMEDIELLEAIREASYDIDEEEMMGR
jgi:hypothetical protein